MAEGLEGLLMGDDAETGSEQAQESESQFKARVAAAQARLAKVKKDESQSRVYDTQLSAIIPLIPVELLFGVILMIDNDVSSLTILATLSLIIKEAHAICLKDFEAHIEEKANFSVAKLTPEKTEQLSDWWTFIFGAEHLSKLDSLHSLRGNEKFVAEYTRFLSVIMSVFLLDTPEESYDKKALTDLVKRYEVQIFSA